MDDETVVLGEELERLDAEADEVASKYADVDDASESAAAINQHANELDQVGRAVGALVEEHGADATVTVRGLNAGEYARVEDRAAAMRQEAGGSTPIPGSYRNVFAAMGIVDAPFIDADADWDDRIRAVASQPPGVAIWLQNKVDDLTTVSAGNWTPLAERQPDTETG